MKASFVSFLMRSTMGNSKSICGRDFVVSVAPILERGELLRKYQN